MSEVTRPVLRYHGGKFRIAPWVIEHFPSHRTYVEPFGGAAGVLFQKPRAYSEVYNDLDSDVVNFFRVLRNPHQLQRLLQLVTATPYARAEFEEAWEPVDEPVERARRLTIRAQMGFGSAGATKGTTGFRIDTKREYETAQHLWVWYPDAISNAAQRLAGVLIENRPAIEVMQQHDGPNTLHFVDPPYVHSTRVMGSGKAGYYRHEMTDEQHVELLDFVQTLRGMVVLSGYRSDLYDSRLQGWKRDETQARASAGRGGVSRTEVLWLNPACEAGQRQMELRA